MYLETREHAQYVPTLNLQLEKNAKRASPIREAVPVDLTLTIAHNFITITNLQ